MTDKAVVRPQAHSFLPGWIRRLWWSHKLALAAVLLSCPFVAPAPSGAVAASAASEHPAPAIPVRFPSALRQVSAPPPNDDLNEATEIGELPFFDSLDTSDASQAPDDPELSCGMTPPSPYSNSVWYHYIAPGDGGVTIEILDANYDTILAAWAGPQDELSEIGCNDRELAAEADSYLTIPVVAGEAYWIEIVGQGSPSGGLLEFEVREAFPPAHDDFDEAVQISELPFLAVVDTSLATTAPDDPVPSCGASEAPQQSHSVWYRYTPAQEETVEISSFTTHPVVISLWTGERGALTEFRCHDIPARSDLSPTIFLEGGTTYYLEFTPRGEEPGGLFQIDLFLVPPPPNDDFANATNITELPFSEVLDTRGATTATDDPAPSCGAAEPPTQSNTVWYAYTAEEDGVIRLQSMFSDYETLAAVWTGERGSLVEVACAHHPGQIDPFVQFSTEAGETYAVEFAQFGPRGGGSLWAEFREAPVSSCDGTRCTLYIEASSDDAGSIPFLPPQDACYYQTDVDNIHFGQCPNGDPITSGFRFNGVQVPGGSIVLEAYLEFVRDGTYDNRLELEIRAEDSSHPQTFSESSRPDQRPLTPAVVPWLIPATELWELGEVGRTPDIRTLVQAVIDRPDWVAGNSLALIVTNAGPASGSLLDRRIIGFDRAIRDFDNDQPRLVITLGVPDPDQSTISIEPTALIADGVDNGTVTVAVRTATGVSLPNASVELQATPNAGVLINGAPAGAGPVPMGVTDADGIATAAIASTQLGDVTLSALAHGVAVNQTAVVHFVSRVTDPSQSTLEVSPTTLPADGITPAVATVTLRDAAGLPVAQHQVALQATGVAVQVALPDPPETDANGVIVGQIRSVEAGPVTIAAVDVTAGVTLELTVDLTFTIGATDPDLSSLVVAPMALTADGTEAAGITATIVDNQGRALPGHQLRLNVSGSRNTISGPNPATTDAAGQATWTLASTKAEVKTLSVVDQTAGVTLTQRPQVTFNPGPLDPVHSLVTPLALFGVADGVTPISVVIRARDAFDNPIPGLSAQLFGTGSAILTQPAGPTDSQGRATGTVVDAVAEQVTLTGTIDGQLIPDQGRVTFRGAEMSLAKTGLAMSNYDGLSAAFALSGGAITYTLTVSNNGPLAAAGVEVSDTLPAGLTFAADLSGLPHQVDGQSITWQVGDLPAAGSVEIAFEAEIETSVLGLVSNSAAVLTATTEFDLADNAADLQTTVELPRPVMKLSPSGPTVTVLQGESAVLTATLRNRGAAAMTGIQVDPPPTIPWVTIELSGLTDLAPRTEANFAVTASPPVGLTSGYYRDFVTAIDDFGNTGQIALTVRVTQPRRDLQALIENDQGDHLHGATITLVRQDQSVVVTQGAVQTYHESAQEKTPASGRVTFTGLETGDYDYTVTAADHITATGVLTVVDGEGPQEITLTLNALGRIGLSPSAPTLGVVRGETNSMAITLTNLGAGPLTGLSIAPPPSIPFVTLGLPDPLPSLQPGERMEFSILAGPAADQSGNIFQDYVTATADDGLSGQLPLTVQLTSDAVRDAEVNLVDTQDQPVTGGGSVTLVQQELTTLLVEGEPKTFNQQFTGQLDASGQASFADLEPGAYNYLASANGYTQETGEIVIQPGTGVQSETIPARIDPFSYTWTVVPIDQGYDITLTLTFDVDTPDPILTVPEVCWSPTGSPTPESIKLYNPSGLPLTVEALSASLPGASIQIGSFPSVIGSRELMNVPVSVTKTGSLGAGSVQADYSWEEAPDKFVTFTLNPSSLTSPIIPPGFFYAKDFILDPAVFDPDTTYTLEIGQPAALAWISLVADQPEPMPWTSDTLITLSMTATPPTFLAEGVYTDSAPITVTGDDGTMRQGSLEFTATKTSDGVYLHTTFVLGEIPTVTRHAIATGRIRGDACSQWTWSAVGGAQPRLIGHTSTSGPSASASFPSQGGGPVYDFGHQQVRIEISQKVMLEGEGFKASLDMVNTSAGPIENVSIDIRLTDEAGLDSSYGFTMIPETPTDLGTIGVGGGASGEWLILPSGLGVTSPEGEVFLASAAIRYRFGGTDFEVVTVPERITVYPAPDLVITYQLPLPDIPCTVFPLKVTIQNRGAGPARNLRFSTAQPELQDPNSGLPIAFNITSATLNGESKANALNLTLGDIPPEGTAVIVWRLESSRPGRFIEFTSDYKQSNYQDLPLSPLISEIRTDLVPGACGGVPEAAVVCPSGECPGIALQGTQGQVVKPINTRTGGLSYNASDLSFPTSAGPLTFERWYATPTRNVYTDILGYGWTHSLDSRLYFPDDPLGQEGVILLKLHSANRYEFIIQSDGTYSAYPGVCGVLTRHDGPPVTYTFVDTAQRVYTFDEAGRLQTLADPQGHLLHYVYDGDVRLTEVHDDTGTRFVSFTYDTEGRIESVDDHSGRQVSYSYHPTTGDLVSATDVLGQAWTYAYDSDHRLLQAVDPRGVIIERSEYDAEGRAVRQFDGAGNRIVELTYNSDGTTIVKDALGHEETYRYDERGALVDRSDPLGDGFVKTYDGKFRPTSITNQAGHTTHMTWDATGSVMTESVDATGATTRRSYDDLNNLVETRDPRGHVTTNTHDGTLLTSTTNALGDTTTYTYTAEGYLESTTDPLGHTTTNGYDEYGQRISVIDAEGNMVLYRYDELGQLIEAEDSEGRITRNEYDDAGHVVKVTRNYDASRPQNDQGQYNIVTQYEYDALGNRTATTDTLGHTTRQEYDSSGHLVRRIDAAGGVTTSTYDANGNLIEEMDALGRPTRFVYDEKNRLLRTIDAMGNVRENSYDAATNTSAATDALGRTTTFIYDGMNRLVETIDPLGNSMTTIYDAAGNAITRIDALGRMTHYEYDALDRIVRETNPIDGITQYVYDEVGNQLQTIGPNGNSTTYQYDELGRVVLVSDALGNATQYAYDERGLTVSMTDPLGRVTRYEYDALDRLVATIEPSGARSEISHDALGNVIARTDALGRLTLFAYDERNQLVSQTDAGGGVTRYEYDGVGNRISIIDPNGHTTRFVYDALNRVIEVVDAVGNSTSMTYDAVGNMVATRDELGNVTTYAFDALNRQIRMADPLNNVRAYEFDAVGNRTAQVDPEGVIARFEYDDLNRLTAVVENYVAASGPDSVANVRTEYSYDAAGNMLAVINGNGDRAEKTYDGLNRPLLETDALGNTTEHVYDAAGNEIEMKDGNGDVSYFEYDDMNRLVGIDRPGTGSDVSFAYDAAGNRVQMTDGLGTTIWSYDALDRVVAVTDALGKATGYSYDAVGNRVGLTYPSGESVTYEFDRLNRLHQVTDWEGQAVKYSYDAAGHMTAMDLPNGVRTSYAYDAAGRLIEVLNSTGAEQLSSFTYTYDARGLRVHAEETVLYAGMTGPSIEAAISTGTPVGGFGASSGSGIDELDPHDAAMLFSLKASDGGAGEAPSSRGSDGSWIGIALLGLFGGPMCLILVLPSSRQRRGLRSARLLLVVSAAGIVVSLTGCTFPPVPPPTSTPSSVPTSTATETSTATATFTPTGTPTSTSTPSLVPTSTATETSTATATLTPTSTSTATPTPEPVPVSRVIDYTYDALGRLTEAVYSTGESFAYAYDAVGNTLQHSRSIGGIDVVTSYSYNEAYQLVTAQEQGGSLWHYTYDGRGQLVRMEPDNGSSGARRYTYNAAGQLLQFEVHDGTSYVVRAEMGYDGLGGRLKLTAHDGGLSLTTEYTLDMRTGGRPLVAAALGQAVRYLYGVGVIGDQASAFRYYLKDGERTIRQTTDAAGKVVLSRSYTPWGEPLDQAGAGNVAFGYLGGLADDVTGLLYMGGGQYYDPATGRFLTLGGRDFDPSSPGGLNPYVPWGRVNPLSALLGPLPLSLFFPKKRKPTRVQRLLLIALLLIAVSMALVACGGEEGDQETAPPTMPPSPTPAEQGPTPTGTTPPTPSPSPTEMPPTPPPSDTPTPTPTYCPPPSWLPTQYPTDDRAQKIYITLMAPEYSNRWWRRLDDGVKMIIAVTFYVELWATRGIVGDPGARAAAAEAYARFYYLVCPSGCAVRDGVIDPGLRQRMVAYQSLKANINGIHKGLLREDTRPAFAIEMAEDVVRPKDPSWRVWDVDRPVGWFNTQTTAEQSYFRGVYDHWGDTDPKGIYAQVESADQIGDWYVITPAQMDTHCREWACGG